MLALTQQPGGAGRAPVTVSADGKAAIGVVSVGADLSGLALDDAVAALRTAANSGLPAALRAHVTGGPAFGADIANAFTDANVTLLAVTASVVALLLIATYRSPVLWLAPLLVIGLADRVATAVGTAVASLTGLSFDGATAGITSVLVFGAGTNYALLMISRYRQELSRRSDHRDALRRAVRMAGPAIARQQRHRRAGVADAAVRLDAKHPQPGRPGGVRPGRRRGVCSGRAAAGARAVRPALVLALHPAPR